MNRTIQDRIKKALSNINISMTIHNQKIEYTSHINRKPHSIKLELKRWRENTKKKRFECISLSRMTTTSSA